MFKFSNIHKAYISTLIGALISIIIFGAELLRDGSFTLEAFLTGAIPFVVAAFTDILGEVKKKLDEPAS